jgi:hypothetical protein
MIIVTKDGAETENQIFNSVYITVSRAINLSIPLRQILQYLAHLSNPADNNGFLKVITIHSMTSFGGEVKPSAKCRKILQHVKEP